ncbi:MAG: hypothetical protein MUF81_21265 [Verrucomicrobia bacterium]|jgi:hypothetical protein|nr:hypothetical protein [Verrucomicrobiota bacterium]
MTNTVQSVKEKLAARAEQARSEIQSECSFDEARVSTLRRELAGSENLAREVERLENIVSSAPAALKLLDAELLHYAERRRKISHRLALALGAGQSIRGKGDEMAEWFVDEKLETEIREAVQRHLIDEPKSRLREIEARLGDHPATPETVEPSATTSNNKLGKI